ALSPSAPSGGPSSFIGQVVVDEGGGACPRLDSLLASPPLRRRVLAHGALAVRLAAGGREAAADLAAFGPDLRRAAADGAAGVPGVGRPVPQRVGPLDVLFVAELRAGEPRGQVAAAGVAGGVGVARAAAGRAAARVLLAVPRLAR